MIYLTAERDDSAIEIERIHPSTDARNPGPHVRALG